MALLRIELEALATGVMVIDLSEIKSGPNKNLSYNVTARQHTANGAYTYIVQGSANNVDWVDLTNGINPITVTGQLLNPYEFVRISFTDTSGNANVIQAVVLPFVVSSTGVFISLVSDIAQFGDVSGGDYSEFEEDGTLLFEGDATVWDDIRVPITNTRINPATLKPDFEVFRNSVRLYGFDDGSEESVHFVAQIPHSWAEGTSIYPHLHWAINVAGSGVAEENVGWGLEYTLANVDGLDSIFPATDTLYSLATDVQSSAQYQHFYTVFDAIDMTGYKISTCLICRLFRDVKWAHPFAQDAFGVEFDFHFIKNTVGSRTETAK